MGWDKEDFLRAWRRSKRLSLIEECLAACDRHIAISEGTEPPCDCEGLRVFRGGLLRARAQIEEGELFDIRTVEMLGGWRSARVIWD